MSILEQTASSTILEQLAIDKRQEIRAFIQKKIKDIELKLSAKGIKADKRRSLQKDLHWYLRAWERVENKN